MGEPSRHDVDTVREQLGREPTTQFSITVRCTGSHPLVIRNHPRDENGDPFPTLYWLTCPQAMKAVARLESEGHIAGMNARAERAPEFAAGLEAAHRAYARERARTLPEAEGWGGVGGTRAGVKCLHAHYANHLAGGDDPVGAWVAENVEPIHGESWTGRVAAIDQGTNSIRLLVVEPADAGMAELARDMVITRLGHDVDRTRRIDPAALARTLDVLERYCRRSRALHADRIRVAATSAVRDASNREELEEAVRRNAGSDLEVISGEREAELSFLGATRGLDKPHPVLVLDIGGGSTEFTLGDTSPYAAISTQMGSVRLTERHVRHDPPAAGEREAMETEIGSVLDDVDSSTAVREARTLVAVGGTPTTLQALALGLSAYDPEAIHRTELARADAERVLERLAAMTTAERAALPVMAPGREDVIVAGASVLVAVMRKWGVDSVVVSEEDILDGLAVEMLATG